MKIDIPVFDAITGWTAANGASVEGLNGVAQYIAGNKDASLILKFKADADPAPLAYAEYVFGTPLPLNGAKEIVFHVWSQKKKAEYYEQSADFAYKIDFGGPDEYYVPIGKTFEHVVLSVSETQISRVRITALHRDVDYLILSFLTACTDQLPLDIFIGVKEQIELEILNDLSSGILVGTADIDEGSDLIDLNPKFLDRNSVIYAKKGAVVEKHQLDVLDSKGRYKLTKLYDGPKWLNNMSAADVYLAFPVEYGQQEKEILTPGIVLWGLAPEQVLRTGKLDTVLDTWKTDGTVKYRREGETQKWSIQIDVQSRTVEPAAVASVFVRRALAKEKIWVNGRKVQIEYLGSPSEEQRVEGINELTKLSYLAQVEILEDVHMRGILDSAQAANLEVNIK